MQIEFSYTKKRAIKSPQCILARDLQRALLFQLHVVQTRQGRRDHCATFGSSDTAVDKKFVHVLG